MYWLKAGHRLPKGVTHAVLGSAEGCTGHQFSALGFPQRRDREATWAHGRVGGVVRIKSRHSRRPVLQFEGRKIDRGMSGTPVLDLGTDRVIGMVSEIIEETKESYGYATTADTLAELNSEIRLHPPQATKDYTRPGGDYTQTIETEFQRHTDRATRLISLSLSGTDYSFTREELTRIENQLHLGKHVVLTGDAGTGKSGIGRMLSDSARKSNSAVLLLDARRVGHVHNEAELRDHLALNCAVNEVVARIARYKGCRLIIDQLDNVVGLPAARILLELAADCSDLPRVEIIIISRKQERHEVQLLQRLSTSDFIELHSYPLTEDDVRDALFSYGVSNPKPELISLGSNMLNLELIVSIAKQQTEYDVSSCTSEVELWELYMRSLVEGEELGPNWGGGEQILAEAVMLARQGLQNHGRTFSLDFPPSPAQRRLLSGRIIEPFSKENDRICRFRHEKFQEYLVAWDATQRHLMPATVQSELGEHRILNVLPWMDKIYAQRNPDLHNRFLTEVLDV